MEPITNPHFEQNREFARRVALSIVARFGNEFPSEAAIQDALVGLFRASQRYDPERAAHNAHGKTAQFTSFAYPFIAGAVRNGIRDRKPQSTTVRHELSTLEAEDLWLENFDAVASDGSAAAAEMLGGLGVVRLAARSDGLDAFDDPGCHAEHRELHHRIGQHCELLPDRQREVLRLLFTESLGVTEIAHRFGVDKAQIARDFRKAIASLRFALCPELAHEKPTRLAPRRADNRRLAAND